MAYGTYEGTTMTICLSGSTHGLAYIGSGVECTVYDWLPGTPEMQVCKTFRDKHEAETALQAQADAAEVGLAPETFGDVIQVYCYECPSGRKYRTGWRWAYISEWVDPNHETGEFGDSSSEDEWEQLLDDLRDNGVSTMDMHAGNAGRHKKGHLVRLDFGGLS